MKKIIALALGAVLLAALSFSMLAAAGCGSSETPSDLIDKSIQKSKDTKTMHLAYDVKLDIKGDASALGPEMKGLLPLSMGISGGMDVDNRSDKAKAQGNIKLDGLDKVFQGLAGAQGTADAQATMGMSMIGSMLADMEIVLVDEKMYIKMGGTWYETDASTASSAASASGITSGTSTSIDEKCIQNSMQDSSKFGATKVMTDVQEVGTEQVNGTDTRHLKANLDLDKAMTEMANTLRNCGDSEGAGSLEAGKSELNSMFRSKSIEMWIDKDGNLLQVKIDIDLDPAAISQTAGALSGADTSSASGLESITMSIKLTISDINKDMSINKPEGNIMKLQDLLGGSSGLGSILGGTSGTTSGSTSGSPFDLGSSTTGTTGGTITRSSTTSQSTSSY